MLVKLWRKENSCALLVKVQIGAATVENSMEFPQKIKNETALWPNNSISGHIFEETKNTNLKDYMQPSAHCNTICNNQYMEATQVPISRWVGKKVVIHIYYGILLGHKKDKILPFVVAWMDLEGIMLSEKASQ